MDFSNVISLCTYLMEARYFDPKWSFLICQTTYKPYAWFHFFASKEDFCVKLFSHACTNSPSLSVSWPLSQIHSVTISQRLVYTLHFYILSSCHCVSNYERHNYAAFMSDRLNLVIHWVRAQQSYCDYVYPVNLHYSWSVMFLHFLAWA